MKNVDNEFLDTLTLEEKEVSEMTGRERQVCAAMSYGSTGDLLGWMRKPLDGDRVLLVRDGPVIVGWSILCRSGDSGYWTRSTYRLRGIGSLMVRYWLDSNRKVRTMPHDLKSAKLFRTTKSLPKGTIRYWQKRIRQMESSNA